MLILAFILILALTFALVLVLTRPTREEKKVGRRFAGLRQGLDADAASLAPIESYLKQSPPTNTFAWFEALAARTGKVQGLRLLLLQSASKGSVGGVLFTCAALSVLSCGILYLAVHMLVIALIVAVIMAYLPIAYLSFKRSRRVAAFDRLLPDCIEMCVRALRAGYSIVAALNIAADQTAEPARTEFQEVFKKQNYGLPLRDALLQMMERMPSTDLRVMATGILVQKDTGGNLAELMEQMAKVIRERTRIRGEIRIHTAQGRFTGWILCLLPIVMMVLLNLITPGYSTVLFTDPTGRLLLYGGVILLLTGGYIIRKMIDGIEV